MTNRRRILLALAGAVLALVGFAQVARADTVSIDGNDPSQTTFDGIGYISADGESRLLIDYPEPQRTQILDLLFCSTNPANAPVSGYCSSGT